MADNVAITAGAGTTIGTDDIAGGLGTGTAIDAPGEGCVQTTTPTQRQHRGDSVNYLVALASTPVSADLLGV